MHHCLLTSGSADDVLWYAIDYATSVALCFDLEKMVVTQLAEMIVTPSVVLTTFWQ